MVSYLTGVLHTPITSFVIVSEMTENHAMVIPLMAAAVIADAVSKLVNRHGLYHALAASLLRQPDPERSVPLVVSADQGGRDG
jgi:H+/Cl- antiporter ClcA